MSDVLQCSTLFAMLTAAKGMHVPVRWKQESAGASPVIHCYATHIHADSALQVWPSFKHLFLTAHGVEQTQFLTCWFIDANLLSSRSFHSSCSTLWPASSKQSHVNDGDRSRFCLRTVLTVNIVPSLILCSRVTRRICFATGMPATLCSLQMQALEMLCPKH